MSTPHIGAEPGDFADVVLMPGDPLRAKYIAEKFLTGVRQVTAVRNMLGFTGEFRGRRVSVMGHGMGMPSISIYATELFKFYGVKTILRVGSCGALAADVKLRDVIIASAAGTDSKVNRIRLLGHDLPAVADFGLMRRAVEAAERLGRSVRVGPVFSSDLFYHPQEGLWDAMEKYGLLGVEMEVAALYPIAAEYNARALGILTVSDHIRLGTHLSAEQRQSTFDDMIEVALEVAHAETA
ncbi:MAG: purine-nucleoside phosphorylase [Polyangiales bacterium]